MTWLRCKIGRPVTHRHALTGGGSIANCNHCGRQTEVHDETRLQRVLGYRW